MRRSNPHLPRPIARVAAGARFVVAGIILRAAGAARGLATLAAGAAGGFATLAAGAGFVGGGIMLLAAAAGGFSTLAAIAAPPQPPQPVSPPGTRTTRPIQLGPSSRPSATQPVEARKTLEKVANVMNTVERGRWAYRVERDDPRDGVPWKLMATPLSDLAQQLKPSQQFSVPERALDLPILKVPENVWKLWFTPDLSDVVGIHYHEFLPQGQAALLITVHKVPADGPDGKPPAGYTGTPGTRLEATLMLPLEYHLDQSLVVRTDATRAKPTSAADGRTTHERGHGQVSLQTLIDALAGPQTWDMPHCKGRRAAIAWYWRAEKTARPWDGYRGGSGKLMTQRTTITLVPPTRWSLLIPKPPDEVSQQQIEAFNDAIVHADAVYTFLDEEAQKTFHAAHGEFEAAKEGP